jgi:tetratricopeptide (TPR) repeat protein
MELIVDAWASAISELEGERDRHPEFADIRYALGSLYLENGRPDEAIEELEAAIAVNPDYWPARFQRLVALRRRDGDLDASLWDRERFAEKVEEPHRSLWTAWYLVQQGDRTGMEKALATLTDARWSALVAFHRWVWLGRERKDWAEVERAVGGHPLYARVLLERSGDLAGTEPWAWNPATASTYETLGDVSARF